MRLVLPRAGAAGSLLAAAAVVAVLTTALLTAFVQYAHLLPVAEVRAALVDAPPLERSLLLRSAAGRGAEEVAARDAAARELFSGGLAGTPLEVHAGGYTASQGLPDDLSGIDADADGAFAVVGFLVDLPAHASLVSGAWPEPVAADLPTQTALPVPVADDLGLAVGDEVAIVDEREGEPAAVEVVGLWQPHDPDDAYWQLTSVAIDRGGWGPFVVHVDDFVARYQVGTLEWLAVADPARLADAGMTDVVAGYRAIESELAQRRDDEADGLDPSARITTGIGALAGQLETATVVNRSGLVLPAALLAVIAAYGLVLVARLLAEHRRGDTALLRARGASRRQLVRYGGLETVLVAAPAALLGAPLGTRLVALADERAGEHSLGLATDLAPYILVGSPLAWSVALVAAIGCAVALLLPAAGRGRTWHAEQQERSRPGRLAGVQRAGVDLALVVLAVLAWTQLRHYGTTVTPTDAGLGIDPLLVAAPVLGVLAAAAIALRLLPLATRLGVRLAGRRDSFPGLLGVWQADRRPHAGPVLLLVLAVATAVLAPGVAATWQQSQRDQAAQEVGADLRVTGPQPRLAADAAELSTLPAVTGTMPVHRAAERLPPHRVTTLLALDSDQAPHVVLLRPDLSDMESDRLFGQLHQDRPEVAGAALPAGAQRLVGRVRYVAPEPVTRTVTEQAPDGGTRSVDLVLPSPVSGALTVHLSDADGVISTVRLGEPDADGRLDIDVPLPPTATKLVGLGASVRTTREFGGWKEPVEVSWHWERLRLVDAAGSRTPLEVPGSWDAHLAREQRVGPEPGRNGAQPAVSVSLQPSEDTQLTLPFVLAAPPPPRTVIPAVVTPDVLEATGGELGQVIRVSDLTVRPVVTVAALPGVANGSGVVVDLAWLTAHQFLSLRKISVANEWWLAAADTVPASAAAQQQGLTVRDRGAVTRRLLGDPLGSGVLLTLWAAAAAAALLAAFGITVDSRATAVRRRRELAVLHTLGTSPPALGRALVVEQAVLAGMGVVAGVLVGLAVAAAMGPSLVLTPAGSVPSPPPLLTVVPAQAAGPTLGLFAAAVALGALVARRARKEVAAGALRIGED